MSWDYRSDLDKTIDKLEQENKRLREALQQVDDVLIVNWITVKDNDYRKALHQLISFSIDVEKYTKE